MKKPKYSEEQKRWIRAEKKCEDLHKLEYETYKKKLRSLFKEYNKAKRKGEAGIYGDFFSEGLKDSEITLVASAGPKLDVRVGPVFGKKGVYKEPGIWVGIQRLYFSSPREIEFLLSPETWKKLSKEVSKRLKKYNPSNWAYKPRKITKGKGNE